MSNPDIRGPAVAFKKMMPSHFHHNLGNINKKEPCCNHQSGCDSQKATDCVSCYITYLQKKRRRYGRNKI